MQAFLPHHPSCQLKRLLVANCRPDDPRECRWNRVQAMRLLGVLGSRLENFLYGFASHPEIAVDSDIPATKYFRHLWAPSLCVS